MRTYIHSAPTGRFKVLLVRGGPSSVVGTYPTEAEAEAVAEGINARAATPRDRARVYPVTTELKTVTNYLG